MFFSPSRPGRLFPQSMQYRVYPPTLPPRHTSLFNPLPPRYRQRHRALRGRPHSNVINYETSNESLGDGLIHAPRVQCTRFVAALVAREHSVVDTQVHVNQVKVILSCIH